jgi:HlyD family secretion protein
MAKARFEAAEARLDSARAALERRQVRAPVDGTILWSRFHAGEFYSQTQGPLLVLGDVEHLQVRLEVDDVDAASLVPGAKCEFRGDDGEPLGSGTLLRVAVEYGSRSLPSERPTDRTDARVREAFVAASPSTVLSPGRRVWGYCPRRMLQAMR